MIHRTRVMTTLRRMEVARGKETVQPRPFQDMSPGRRPSGRLSRPERMRRRPTGARRRPEMRRRRPRPDMRDPSGTCKHCAGLSEELGRRAGLDEDFYFAGHGVALLEDEGEVGVEAGEEEDPA